MQKGSISVQTENIFPIIKQFLYSDQEIFLRELISNAIDATNKLKAYARKGEFDGNLDDLAIEVLLDETAQTLTIRDKGIGMTEEEVKKYLNQVAFSSAAEFLEKYKDESVIGHFGLGFYSAFMVAKKVQAVTKSYKGTEGVTWTCEGNPEYTIEANDKAERGTDIVLFVGEEHSEYLEKSKIKGLLQKYCKFLPVEIKFEGEVINNTAPIWKKNPNDLTDEDYKNFYNELYPYSQPPLFWIHLNIDYPFNLTGILYFPKLNNAIEVQQNKIQLYSNQVYVTDDVREIVPEFLTLLHGVIDSPDIPLNVSRSSLQSDANVKKITSHITKKVADKLNDLFKENRTDYEEKWSSIGTLVKYGMITDDKFYDRAAKFALLKNVDEKHFTISEYKEKIEINQKDKNDRLVALYTNNALEHDSFIATAKNYGYDVLVMDTVIDNHFIQQLEQKGDKLSFTRVDSNTVDKLIEKDELRESVLSEDEQNGVKTIFETQITDPSATVMLEPLSPDDMPVVIIKPEFMRRMREMSALQGMGMGSFPDTYNVVVNSNHPLVGSQLLAATEEQQAETVKYLYNLALLNQGMLKGAALTAFVNKSLGFLQKN